MVIVVNICAFAILYIFIKEKIMKFTNRELRAKLREMFNDNTISDNEYCHAEMFVNSLLEDKNPNHKKILRDVYKRPLGTESGGEKYGLCG